MGSQRVADLNPLRGAILKHRSLKALTANMYSQTNPGQLLLTHECEVQQIE